MSDYIPEFKVGDLVIKAGERIAELEEQLAAAQTENERLKKSVVWDVVNALACADEYKCELAAAQAEIARLREGGCAREQGTSQYCAEAAEAQIAKLERDAAMLDWLADHKTIRNINGVNLSIYETAMCIAYERDVDAEPTVEDYRLALRLMIRTAINAEAAEAARGNDD